MAKNPSHPSHWSKRTSGVACESVHFAEVDFVRPVTPRLVIQFSDGLSILVENSAAIDLAAEFIAAFRAHEKGGSK